MKGKGTVRKQRSVGREEGEESCINLGNWKINEMHQLTRHLAG